MEINTQPILKQDLHPEGLLLVHHFFPTIQGEGILAGWPALFIRLYGCNLQCPMCDTDYSSTYMPLRPEELYAKIEPMLGLKRLVVITGGEPFRQNIVPFVNYLLSWGCLVQIETNGTLYLEDLPYENEDLVIMCSPKTGKVNKKLIDKIDAFKYVLHADDENHEDGLPIKALDHSVKKQVARPPANALVYIQPIDVEDAVENKRHLEAAVDSAIGHGHVLCLQTHKIIGVE